MGAAWRVLTFPREGQEEIYGGRNYVLGAGAAQPITGVERVEGGYRLTGRTAWNSGASHAEWFTINGLLIAEGRAPERSEEHTSELPSLMRISDAVFRLKKKNNVRPT